MTQPSDATVSSLIPTICPYCGVGCGLYVAVEDGRAVGLEYMPEHPVSEGSLCPKGNAVLEVLNHPDRLQYPMKKTNGGWERISWDEALDLVAERLRSIRDSRSADSLGFLASAKCTNEENYLFQKLARLLGTNNVDHCARLCHAPTVVGLARAFGSGAMTNPIPDLANADCIFIIGSNLAENHAPVARWLLRAKEKGAKVIVADPRLTPTAWLADTFLPIRPGTDVALLNGLMHVIIEEGLTDPAFIGQRTSGYDELVKVVQDYTPDHVAHITGVPPALIVEAARAYGKASSAAIVYCMGITQHTTGSDNVAACANLALICGQVGRPGAGLWPLRGQNNVQGACDMGALAEFYPGYRRVDAPQAAETFRQAWGSNLQPPISNLNTNPGLTVVEMMNAAAAGEVKAMYIMGENPLLSDPNAGHVRQALEALDFLVVQDIFLTETAQLADVVLPAAAWAEKEGTFTSTGRRVQWSHRAVAPPGEARDDLWIIGQVAQRLGFDFFERQGLLTAAAVLSEINQLVPSYGGIAPQRLFERQGLLTAAGGLFWPCPEADHPGTPILHTEAFSTPDGRARIVPVRYVPPAEEISAGFPLVLTTGRVAVHHNAGSMTRRSPSLMNRAPELFVEIHPTDAAQLGITEGEAVAVTTARGNATAKARITDKVQAGAAFMPFHFSGTNQLTMDALDAEAKIPEFKVAASSIGKIS
jgi:formate dehydrogenase alpha subunit